MSAGSVLVTGAGGFVGSAIVRRLVARPPRYADAPAHVVALLSPTGTASRLEELRPDRTWSIERADIADGDDVRALLARVQPRAIVHAALPADAFRTVFDEADDPLVARPLRVLFDALAGRPDARFIHVGSAWVLESGDRLGERARVAPRSPYARNKARADALIPRLAERAGVAWINLRLFNVFGRYEDPSRLIPTLVARLSRGEVAELTHGEQVRDFNDVDVVANAFAAALGAPPSACNALYHIGSGRATRVRDAARIVAERLGHPELVRFGAIGTQDDDVPSLVADPALARRCLGWEPDLDLEERLGAATAWWLRRLTVESR